MFVSGHCAWSVFPNCKGFQWILYECNRSLNLHFNSGDVLKFKMLLGKGFKEYNVYALTH